ncbi:ferric-dicitrate binding protein FerR, regulates iron transport through sigma-19 [Parapedobacter composti]|uniref:Ferric-dicitrate binding protein FerR, regulates iron transport through sigma-19 n=1 Tax=Parapedobacter composti TaxID=623281 RepID=A0A1I1L5Q4_9SPHI|nr:FecR family protein [Parapedobacter composti]SFC68359.1 ferric-dicitrate binding protein FerR, regulates iron transport through sigma-19 [Parapedobacter composti]
MDSEKFKQLLHRYLSGTATDAEKEAIDAWYASYRELDDAEVFKQEEEAARIASEMHGRLSRYWAPPRRLAYRRYVMYAATVCLVVGVAWLVFRWQSDVPGGMGHEGSVATNLTYHEVSTTVRQVKQVTLPDSSTVWVNALSQLRIPESFGKTSREVYLDEGEAFFEVAPDLNKPFIVHSRGIVTRVLGTAFNITNYQRLNRITVDVAHGKVQVTGTGKRLPAAELTAAQRLTFNTLTGAYDRTVSTTGSPATWREGVVALRNASFDELALAVRNCYGIELKAGNNNISSHRYSLTIRTAYRLEETLRIICSIHQHQYRRENNEVIIY